MNKSLIYLLLLSILLTLSSCASSPEQIEEGLSPAGFFQRAQEASEEGDFQRALRYYRVFQERYPGELERNLWASYEIAFLYYKMGEHETALELLEQLIKRYDTEEAAAYPPAPLVLAEKVKVKIQDKLPKE